LEETGVVGVVDIFAEDTCVKGITTSSVEGFTVSELVSDATNCGGDFDGGISFKMDNEGGWTVSFESIEDLVSVGNEGSEVISVVFFVELVSKPMQGESEVVEDLVAIVVLDG
jgi:hypothetical protein